MNKRAAKRWGFLWCCAVGNVLASAEVCHNACPRPQVSLTAGNSGISWSTEPVDEAAPARPSPLPVTPSSPPTRPYRAGMGPKLDRGQRKVWKTVGQGRSAQQSKQVPRASALSKNAEREKEQGGLQEQREVHTSGERTGLLARIVGRC
jgi:hypothetical protein